MAVRSPSRRWSRRWSLLADATRTQVWPLPAAAVAVACVGGVVLPPWDTRLTNAIPPGIREVLFSGGPDAAREVLSAVAGSLITVTSLTFSLTVVTLQLASSQYSPRILRTFSRDRAVHATLALMLGTFVYALTVLRTVRSPGENQETVVPHLSITLALGLTLASVVVLVLFLAHLARQIRVESILRDVHETTLTTMRRVLGEQDSPGGHRPSAPSHTPSEATPLCARSSGFLTSVDAEAILAAALDTSAVVVLERLPGDSLVEGTPIARAWDLDGGRLDDDTRKRLAPRVARAVRTGFERTNAQDVAFGLRQVVDIAIKALSPGINDPTTAVYALGHASALLGVAVRRDLGPHVLRDSSGRARVVLRRPDLANLLDLTVTQTLQYAAGDPEVLARLATLLREVAWLTDGEQHHRVIQGQVNRMRSVVEHGSLDPVHRERLRDLLDGVEDARRGHWLTP